MADNRVDATEQMWEQKTIEKMLMTAFKEQRRSRRWGIFFKLLLFIYLFATLWLLWPSDGAFPPEKDKSHVGVIEINGVIGEKYPASADNIIPSLQEAFKDKKTVAVILDIDSPGGTPVQAANVYDEVRYLRSKNPGVKVYAVCSDLCTSAAYYIASSADEIYASPVSLIGSMGVLLDGFGFVDTMQKLGVQRRLLTAGAHKGFLDPFSPMKPDEQQFAQKLLDNVHQTFIQSVEQGRGKRLKETPDTFSGLVWTGNQALPLGLIDGFGSVTSVARDVIKNDNIVDYTVKPNFFQQMSDRFSASFAHELAARFGLDGAKLE